MKSSSDSLLRSRFTRRTATVTISAPLASSARAVSWKDLYFPVPTMRRERKERPAMINESDMGILYLRFAAFALVSNFDEHTRNLVGRAEEYCDPRILQ